MKRVCGWLLLLFAALLTTGFMKTNVAADTTSAAQVLPAGDYTINVSYYTDAAAKTPSNMMSGFWEKTAELKVNDKNQATLTFKQNAGMSVMNSASFNNKSLAAKQTNDTGTWSVNLSPQDAVKLVNGNTYGANVVYNVGGKSSKEDFYVKIDSGIPDALDQPGSYQLTAYYENATQGGASMIQSGGLWSDTLNYRLNADGTAALTLSQPLMMDYMSNLSFDGTSMTKTVSAGNASSGTWEAELPISTVRKLTVGNTVKASMTYTVPGIFTHTVEVNIVIKNKTLTKADALTTVAQPATGETTINNETSSADTAATVDKASSTENSNPVTVTKDSSTQPAASGAEKTDQTDLTAVVDYNQVDSNGNDLNERSMIQTDGIWSTSIALKKNGAGTVTVTIKQLKMMSYMNSVKFDGVAMVKNATAGTWTATLSKTKAADLKAGKKILLEISYTVPNMFTHNVEALAVITKIVDNSGKVIDAKQSSNDAVNSNEKTSVSDQIAPVTAVKEANLKNTATTALPQTGEKPNYPYEVILGVLAIVTAAGLIIASLRLKRAGK